MNNGCILTDINDCVDVLRSGEILDWMSRDCFHISLVEGKILIHQSY